MLTTLWYHLTGHPTPQSAPKPAPQCLMCGDCCKSFGGHLHATTADLKRWQELGRDDILAHVGSHGYLWVEAHTHHIVQECPFLKALDEERCGCSIHEVKPDICRAYPTLAHGHRCLKGVFLQATLIWVELSEIGLVELTTLA